MTALRLYPEILIEIVVSNTPTNLIEDGIDFWIHGFELSELQPDRQEGCRDLSRNRCDSDIP
jgi:DNA-binding transcriptional LysR family regulator